MAWSPKRFFRPFGLQFSLKIRRGPGPPDPSPGSATAVNIRIKLRAPSVLFNGLK